MLVHNTRPSKGSGYDVTIWISCSQWFRVQTFSENKHKKSVLIKFPKIFSYKPLVGVASCIRQKYTFVDFVLHMCFKLEKKISVA